jgi:hypothetical protein
MDTIKRASKRATPRSKKTIRKMTPLARKLAHLTRAMQSSLKRLAYLTEALYELERSEIAAQAQIIGHASVCPLVKEPSEPPAAELFPQLPNGEGISDCVCRCGHLEGDHESTSERLCGALNCLCPGYEDGQCKGPITGPGEEAI